MKIKYHLLFVLLALLCYACEKDIELDLSKNKKLVLLASFEPDSLFKVSLSTSVPVGTPGSIFADYPTDARIQLFKDGEYLSDFNFEPLTIDNFIPYYVSDHRPQAGGNYAIKAQYQDYPDISASSTIPMPPQVGAMEVLLWDETSDAYAPNQSYYFAKVKLPIDLPASTTSYYQLLVKRQIIEYELVGRDTLKYFATENIFSNLAQLDQSTDWDQDHLIKSTQLDANNPALEVDFDFQIDRDYELKGSIFFELRRVSKDYYRFHKSRKEQDLSNFQQSILYNEPVLIYNNIEGGLGNFSGYHAVTQHLDW